MNDTAEYERIGKKDATEDKISKVKACHAEAKKHQRKWRAEALESYEFRDNRQWSEEDTATLESEERPIVTFNRIQPYFDAVQGTEINNRQEIKYLPRTLGDSQQCEILTAAVKWACDRTNAQDEESDAFGDMLVGGMGFIETRMDYDEDADGKICMERVDPLEMAWDPKSRKRNLQDAGWLQRTKWLSKEEITDRWPKIELTGSATPWGDEAEDKIEPHNANLAFLYRENGTDSYDEKTGKHRVVQHMYWSFENVYRTLDPQSGKLVELDEKRYKLAQQASEAAGTPIQSVKTRKKVYRYIFIVGDEVAEEGPLKCGFNIKAMTGKRDQNTGLFYGLTRVMKDPQRWANKFLAQIMHIVNTNAKGGLLAETGAFVDPKKAQEDWSDPSKVVILKNGGIAKIKERTAASYPQGLDKLLQFAIASIPDATGINLEFMGMQDRAQANVLEQTRKKSAFVILAGFFDALRLYRKEQGRLLAHFVKEYMNDGRIIRITTDQGEVPIPLQLTEEAIDYDVVVDQAPDSPNLKEEVWGALKELIPQMLKAGMPIPPTIFKYSPLPISVSQEFSNGMQGKLPPKAQEAMQKMQQQLQMLTKENEQLKQQAQIKVMQDQTKKQIGMTKNQVEVMKIQAGHQAAARDADNEAAHAMVQAQLDEKAALREIQVEMLKAQQEHAREMAAQKMQLEHEMELQRRDLTAQILTAQVTEAKNEAKATKAAKPSDDAQKIAKIVSEQSKDIAAMTKLIAEMAKMTATVVKSLERPEKDDEPKKYEVARDGQGRIKTIAAVH